MEARVRPVPEETKPHAQSAKATTKKSLKCVWPKYATCPHPMIVPSTPYAVAASPRLTARGAASDLKPAATSGSSENTPIFAKPAPPQANARPDTIKKKVSVLYIAMYGQTVRAEVIVPSGTSMGNRRGGKCRVGKALTQQNSRAHQRVPQPLRPPDVPFRQLSG